MENEVRELVRDYLNDMYSVEEILNKFDLIKCPICGEYNLEEDMLNHKWDKADAEEKICESCRGDE